MNGDRISRVIIDSRLRPTRSRPWRATGVDEMLADPGPREPLPVRPRDLRRAVRNDGLVG